MTVEEFLLRRDTFDKFIKDVFDYPHLTVVDELTKKSLEKLPKIVYNSAMNILEHPKYIFRHF